MPEEEECFSNPNIEIFEGKRDDSMGFRDMRVMTIQYQQHHVMLDICIQAEMFSLRTLIDTGANVNVLNSKLIPAKYWIKSFREVVGLGNKNLLYEVPQASICFKEHCIKLKFAVADIPIDSILGNVFLAAVEPHGSNRLKGNKSGYFITVPSLDGKMHMIKLPFVSTPRVSTMVQDMQQIEKASNILIELKDQKTTIKIGDYLQTPIINQRISSLRSQIEK